MKYTIYKITNEIDGKIYIGCHKTNNLKDGYMGSGEYLKRAQEKYGLENFTKEILEVFDNPEDMFDMESILVNKEFVQSKETYNLKEGGFGGFDYINQNRTKEHNDKLTSYLNSVREKSIKAKEWLFTNDSEWYEEFVNSCSVGSKKYYESGGENGFKDKFHSEETKRKIGEANRVHQTGEGNSQFGTIWIHNLELKLSKKIKKEDLPTWEQEGWLKGRKIKF